MITSVSGGVPPHRVDLNACLKSEICIIVLERLVEELSNVNRTLNHRILPVFEAHDIVENRVQG